MFELYHWIIILTKAYTRYLVIIKHREQRKKNQKKKGGRYMILSKHYIQYQFYVLVFVVIVIGDTIGFFFSLTSGCCFCNISATA